MTACKAAVKDGTILGPEAAEQLARDALLLKDPHCPHGRPVAVSLTRKELDKQFKVGKLQKNSRT